MSQLPTAEYILGLDLSGPSNIKDTALAVFQDQADRLSLISVKTRVSDPEIFALANSLAEAGRVRFGLDAPLSYNPGCGDRPGDKNLRRLLTEAGLPVGSVMTPTMTRMAYLTLRGMSLARGLGHIIRPAPQIAEVHPGGALLLRGAPLNAVRTLKKRIPEPGTSSGTGWRTRDWRESASWKPEMITQSWLALLPWEPGSGNRAAPPGSNQPLPPIIPTITCVD